MMKMIDHVCAATVEYIDHMPKSKRKKYGQFFTSKETAVFMAGLFSIPAKHQVKIWTIILDIIPLRKILLVRLSLTVMIVEFIYTLATRDIPWLFSTTTKK